MKKEVWKDIVGYEGLYQVSNFGNVKRVEHQRYNFNQILHEKEIKQSKDAKGYTHVQLFKNGVGITHLVHKLVAQAFIPNPNNLPQINHKDEIKCNNDVDNLEWCTSKYNNNYGNRLSKVSKVVSQYTLNGNFIRNWDSVRLAERSLKIAHICACCKGKRKSAGNFKWKYCEDIN